jgi:hypothetical protein
MQYDDFRGKVYDYTPAQDEIIYANNAVKTSSKVSIYARVGVFLDDKNKLAFAELPKSIKERIIDHEEIS